MGCKSKVEFLNTDDTSALTVFLCLILLCEIAIGQNLIPNSSFEKHINEQVLDWKQPMGGFYHYRTFWVKQDNKPQLVHMNGLCILNDQASEYLLVKLIEPLKEGVSYTLSMECYAEFKGVRSFKGIDAIDCLFLEDSIDVSTRRYVVEEPSVQFELNEFAKVVVKPVMQRVYVAKGNEQYLLIGKLHRPSIYGPKVIYDSIQQQLSNLRREWYTGARNAPVPMEDMMLSMTNERKAKRRMDRAFNKARRAADRAIKLEEKTYQPILDSLKKKMVKVESNDIRFYFDNVYLMPTETFTPWQEEVVAPFTEEVVYHFNNVVFDINKDVLKAESQAELDNLSLWLIQNPRYTVELIGHTDNVNNANDNLVLSEKRALACKNYLVQKGIAISRIQSKGKGESEPIVSNDTEEGRAINRRVDFILHAP